MVDATVTETSAVPRTGGRAKPAKSQGRDGCVTREKVPPEAQADRHGAAQSRQKGETEKRKDIKAAVTVMRDSLLAQRPEPTWPSKLHHQAQPRWSLSR